MSEKCLVSQELGHVFVLGQGDCGQLGRGEDFLEAKLLAPTPLSSGNPLVRQPQDLYTKAQYTVFNCILLFQVINNLTGLSMYQVRSIAAGGVHSLAVTDDGTVYSTGVNDEGALGRRTGKSETSIIRLLHVVPLRMALSCFPGGCLLSGAHAMQTIRFGKKRVQHWLLDWKAPVTLNGAESLFQGAMGSP